MEVKFSTKKSKTNSKSIKPKWNSNIPKNNAIYVFSNPENLTYFIGGDYIDPGTRNKLVGYFSELKTYTEMKKSEIKKEITILGTHNPFGLYPQIRTDFLERKDFEIGRKSGENKIDIFEFSDNNNWESNVEYFLNGLKDENE